MQPDLKMRIWILKTIEFILNFNDSNFKTDRFTIIKKRLFLFREKYFLKTSSSQNSDFWQNKII